MFMQIRKRRLAACLAVACTAAYAGSAFAADAPISINQSMDQLWSQHMEWTYATVAAFANNSPDLGANLARLLQNQQDIGNSVKAYYGDQYGMQLASLLTTHITDAVPVLVAARAGDTAALNTAVAAWYANAKQIGDLLAAANPEWAKDGMGAMWQMHITQTIAYSVDLLHADPAQAIKDYGLAEMHMMMMGDMLSAGLVHGMSTQLYPDVQAAIANDGRYVRNAVYDRLDAGCTEQRSSGADCASGFWVSPYGAWGHLDGDTGSSDLDHEIGGVALGADRALGQDWRVGVMGGLAHARSELDGFGSSARNNGYTLGVYTGGHWDAWRASAGVVYAWNDVDASRTVLAVPGFADAAQASYRTHTTEVFAELGRDLALGRWTLTPFARLAYANVRTNAFTETGDAAAVRVDGANVDLGSTTLGARGSVLLHRGDGTVVSLHGLAGWEHALGAQTPSTQFVFSNDVTMTQTGVPLARNAMDLGAGIGVDVGARTRINVDYVGRFAKRAVSNGAQASVQVAF
jgi:outer membrane autotransporter protein